MQKKIKRWIPLFILIVAMGIAYFSGLTEHFTFDALKTHRQSILQFNAKHWFLSPLCFIAIYTVSTALSLPIGIFLSITAGFLFSQPLSTIYVVIGATLGASCIFLIAKTSIGEYLRKKAGPNLQKIEKGFHENKVSYLLFLRLVPLFPFWLVNLAPAFFGVSLATFMWTTCVGIIPGTFVFTQAGAGLGAILDSGEKFSISGVFNWQIRIALLALGFFALIPILIKKFKKKKESNHIEGPPK